jgi:pimeloyl-ACP methyl ester carboxylesterase
MKAVVNGGEIFYVDVGVSKATPIVLIHGFPFSHGIRKLKPCRNDFELSLTTFVGMVRAALAMVSIRLNSL